MYSSITDKMILDMDFSLKDDDILECYDLSSNSDLLYNNVVTAVSDTVFDCSTDKVHRKCVYVHVDGRPLDHPLFTDVWVEGIGLSDPIRTSLYEREGSMWGAERGLH